MSGMVRVNDRLFGFVLKLPFSLRVDTVISRERVLFQTQYLRIYRYCTCARRTARGQLRTNPGLLLGLGSSRPESTQPGQLGLFNLIKEAAYLSVLYNCMGIDRKASDHCQ